MDAASTIAEVYGVSRRGSDRDPASLSYGRSISHEFLIRRVTARNLKIDEKENSKKEKNVKRVMATIDLRHGRTVKENVYVSKLHIKMIQ